MKFILLFILFLFCTGQLKAQDTLRLTLEEAVALAREQSPQAVAARHQYRAAYWNWRTFKADYLPSLSFNSYSSLNRSISPVTLPDGSDSFLHRNQLLNEGSLTINQNIALLGGSLFLETGVQRLDLFTDKRRSFKSTPIVIGYSQNLFGYNRLKWDRKIEPARYKQAQKSYLETLELVAAMAANKFFALATAQNKLQSANYNYAAADTLFRYAKGRYDIGTITENEMLQLEINHLTEQSNRLNAGIEVDNAILELRSFLGIRENVVLVALVSSDLPVFMVPVADALHFAWQNSPDIEWYALQQLQSESSVAQAKASRGLKADLYMQVGLTQTATRLNDAYRNPMDQQLVSLNIHIPLVDWGVGKGRLEVARSNLEKTKTEIAQARTDFEANVIKLVKQFNLQAGKVTIAQKRSDRAARRNEVAYRLYLLGKSTLLDLNAAIAEKDSSQRDYISEMQNYWSLYYALRSITGYDFQLNCPIFVAVQEF
jgi:outer membrane protein TolC